MTQSLHVIQCPFGYSKSRGPINRIPSFRAIAFETAFSTFG
jgi:hypothetical protein